MTIIQNRFEVPKDAVLALGNFDGVHTAHALLLETARRTAREKHLPFGVYTFRVNTKLTLGVDGFAALTTDDERASRIAACGADFLFEEDFTTVRALYPDEFVSYLQNTLHASSVVCGEDFRFGKDAAGKPSQLCKYLPTVVVPTLYDNGQAVSSTWIRRLIREGDVETAAKLLGYRYGIEAKVIHGQSLGHTLGFPTVNQLAPYGKITPKRGVYCVLVHIADKTFAGACNVGVRPTVYGEDSDIVVFETNIIGFDGDLYGKTVRLEFCSFLRPEKKFGSVEALKAQVLADIEEAKRCFEIR